MERAPGDPELERFSRHAVLCYPTAFVALLLISAFPLVPRPTAAGLFSLAAPAAGALLVYVAGVSWLTRDRKRDLLTPTRAWGVAGLAATVWYAMRVGFDPSSVEIEYVASRVLLLALIFSLAELLRPVPTKDVLGAYSWGFMGLAVIVLIVGVTGWTFLEAPRPARTLGVTLPWYKTPGVPRSYGEQAIVVSIMLAFVIGYWSRLRTARRWILLSACVVVTVLGQSRNMLLAAVVVALLAVWVLPNKRWRLLRVCVIMSALATFVVEVFLPLLTTTGVGRALIGEGIYAENVAARFALIDGVALLVGDRHWSAVLGFDHLDWVASDQSMEGAGVHNHFVATLLFFGIPAGLLMLWAILFAPIISILRSLERGVGNEKVEHDAGVVLIMVCGVLVSLNFYEGFFSLSLALVCALLWVTAERLINAPLSSRNL